MTKMKASPKLRNAKGFTIPSEQNSSKAKKENALYHGRRQHVGRRNHVRPGNTSPCRSVRLFPKQLRQIENRPSSCWRAVLRARPRYSSRSNRKNRLMTLCEFGSISSAPITLLKKQSIPHDALRLLPANESLSRCEAMRSRNSPTVSLRDPSINCRNSGIDSNPKSDGLRTMLNRPLMRQLKQTSAAGRADQTHDP